MYKSFEMTLPFTKLKLIQFQKLVKDAENESENSKGSVTKEALQKAVPELYELSQKDSSLYKLLTNVMFISV